MQKGLGVCFGKKQGFWLLVFPDAATFPTTVAVAAAGFTILARTTILLVVDVTVLLIFVSINVACTILSTVILTTIIPNLIIAVAYECYYDDGRSWY